MNAYNFSIKDMQFKINQIEKGVQITYELQDKAIRVLNIYQGEFISVAMTKLLAHALSRH